MVDLKIGDTITCKDIQDATEVLAKLHEAGFHCIVWTEFRTGKPVVQITEGPYEAKEDADG